MIQSLTQRRSILRKAAIASATVAAVIGAPLLLGLLAPAGTDWGRLSDISQTYGTPLSIAALLGVAVSLTHQSRQTTITYQEAQRAAHRQLVTMAIDDPDLVACWDPFTIPVTALDAKRIFYTNLIISQWSADYKLKRFNDAALRMRCRTHFQGEIARKHWENGGADWREFAEALGEPWLLRFVTVLDTAYADALASGPPRPAITYFTPPSA
ncbi:DUF6082 family protein [Streptomyces luteogriseus]|uniref:DUF6082 family protein n=1 Tax=Streptomyces luteogriseus TaxID=68233 RepID=UPI0037AFBD67